MKKLFLTLCVLVALSACTKTLPEASYDIIPQPKELTLDVNGAFTLSSKTIVYYEAGLQREAQFLSEYVDDILGYGLKIQEHQSQSDGILLRLDPECFDHAEAYEINITPKQVTIKGSDAAGVR